MGHNDDMENESPVTHLSEDRAWDLLAKTEVGRLATAINHGPEIFPINYVVDGESIVFRTAEGNKLLELTINDRVCFEIDGWTDQGGWSVILKGHAEEITDAEELARAEKLPLLPWVPTVKLHYVRVIADEVTARGFVFGEEPERPYTLG